MAEPRSVPPGTLLPTLTEVVAEGAVPARPAGAAEPAVLGADEEARLVDGVLAGLQQRMDLMFEYRLRETLTPLLARTTEHLVREAREELARTLRDVVARAVSQELARRRSR